MLVDRSIKTGRLAGVRRSGNACTIVLAISAAAVAGLGACGPKPAVDHLPVLVSPAVPVYPDSARNAGIEGDVLLEMAVGPDGRVESATILRGDPALHRAARNAAMQMVFTPGSQNGRPVRVRVAQRISFQLAARTGERENSSDFPPVDTQPVILLSAAPIYPDSALRAGIEGEVFVWMVVGTDGKVESAEVRDGLPVFHEAARAAAMEMGFAPATANGVPKRARTGHRFSFRINDAPAAPAGSVTPAEIRQTNE